MTDIRVFKVHLKRSRHINHFYLHILLNLHPPAGEGIVLIFAPPYLQGELELNQDSLERASAEAWDQYRVNNRSVIVDIFAGQLKSTLRCLNCKMSSTTFDPFVRR